MGVSVAEPVAKGANEAGGREMEKVKEKEKKPGVFGRIRKALSKRSLLGSRPSVKTQHSRDASGSSAGDLPSPARPSTPSSSSGAPPEAAPALQPQTQGDAAAQTQTGEGGTASKGTAGRYKKSEKLHSTHSSKAREHVKLLHLRRSPTDAGANANATGPTAATASPGIEPVDGGANGGQRTQGEAPAAGAERTIEAISVLTPPPPPNARSEAGAPPQLVTRIELAQGGMLRAESASGGSGAPPPPPIRREYLVTVAIDFGTTYSGYAFAIGGSKPAQPAAPNGGAPEDGSAAAPPE